MTAMSGVETSVAARWANAVGGAWASRRLEVLAYHDVPDRDLFARHLDVISSTRNPVSLDDVVASITDRVPLPGAPVLVTFDDGDPTVLDHAAPELLAAGVPAVAFVVSSLVGSDSSAWWVVADHAVRHGGRTDVCEGSAAEVIRALKRVPDADRRRAIDELSATASVPVPPARQLSVDDLRLLEASGVAVASHTATHPCLHRCPPDLVREELTASRERLGELLGHPVVALAYPNGDLDDSVVAAASAAGYRVAFAFDHRVERNPPVDPLRVSRLRVDATAPIHRLRSILSGVHPAVHRARGRS